MKYDADGALALEEQDIAFVRDLGAVLNRHGWDSRLNTPDFGLAGFLYGCLLGLVTVDGVRGRWTKDDNWFIPVARSQESDPATETSR